MGNTSSANSGNEVPVLDLPQELSTDGADAGFGGIPAAQIQHVESHEAAAIAAAAALNLRPLEPTAADEEEARKEFSITQQQQQLVTALHEYRLESKVLGEGGFGKVKLATHQETGHQVAVKIIKRNRLKERAELLLQREVANHALLRHANIVRLYTWIKTPQRYYLVMEYCPHGDLLAFLNKKGRFTDQEARHFLRQLLEGLAFCHSLGIYHRDLKLENLMLTDSEDASGALMIKIADFGLSALKPIGLLETHCGSPLYAAPELMQDKGEYDGSKSDMWSVGVILFAMLASALPFDASDMGSLVRLICQGKPTRPIPVERGVEARQLVKALLCVDPATRPSAAEALEHEWLQTDAANDAIKASMTLDSLPTTLGDKMDRKSESKADDDDAPALARNRSAPIDRTSDGAMPAAPVVPPAKPVPTAQTEKGHVKNSELAPPAEESVRAEPAVDAAGTRQPKLPVDGAAAPSLSTTPTRGVSATSAFFKEMLAEEEARKLQKAPGEGVEEEEAGGVPSCTTRRAGAPLTKEDLAQIRAEMEREEAGDTS